MKIPSRVKIGVQSLGRESVGQRLQTGAAISRAASGVSSALFQMDAQNQRELEIQAEELRREKLEAQKREAGLRMSNAMVQFEEQYGNKDAFTADEIPESVSTIRTEKMVGPNGTIEEVPRGDIPAYEVMPDIYKYYTAQSSEAAASLIEDEQERANWLAQVTETANAGYINRLRSSRAEQERFIEAELQAQINESVDRGQYGIAEELAQDISNPELRQETIGRVKLRRETDQYYELINSSSVDSNSLEQLEQAASNLRDPEFNSQLSDNQRYSMLNQMDAAINKGYAAEIARQNKQKSKIESDTWLLIDDNDPMVSEETVDSLFERDVITGSTRTSMIRAIRDNNDKAVNEQLTAADLDAIALAPHGIDPKSKDMRKAVNSRYEEYKTQTEDISEAAGRIMREFKVVPDEVQSIFRANNRADARGLVQAATMYRDAMKYAPQSMADFSDNDVDTLARVAANMELGMPPADAVESVKMWESMTPQQRDALRNNNAALEQSNVEVLKDKISDSPIFQGGSFFGMTYGVPEVPLTMEAEFGAAVQKYLPTVGYSIPVAQQMAFGEISKKWTRTEVNGQAEIMKNAPNGPIEDIRAQIKAQYKGQMGNRKFSDIRISSNQLTALDLANGRNPRYRAYIITDPETQEIEFLDDFTWDPKAAAENRKAEIMEQARAARERRQKAKEVEVVESPMGTLVL